MVAMTRPKKTTRADDRHATKAFTLRLEKVLKEGLESLAKDNFTGVTAEIRAAIIDRLRAKGKIKE